MSVWEESTTSGKLYWSNICSSSTGQYLAVTDLGNGIGFSATGGYIYTSDDYGSTWTQQTGAGSKVWTSISMSSNGLYLAACASNAEYSSHIYTSNNRGVSWTLRNNLLLDSATKYSWRSITISDDGTRIAACADAEYKTVITDGSFIFTSSNSGSSWISRNSRRSWSFITSSPNGVYLAACEINGYIYTSSNSGTSFIERTGAGIKSWTSIAISDDGKIIALTVYLGYIYTSSNSGQSFTSQTGSGSKYWGGVCSSSTGQYLAACEGTTYGKIYTSNDYGVTWIQHTHSFLNDWGFITSSSDGKRIAVCAYLTGINTFSFADPTNYRINGVDISRYFSPYSAGSQALLTEYKITTNKTDLNTIFAPKTSNAVTTTNFINGYNDLNNYYETL